MVEFLTFRLFECLGYWLEFLYCLVGLGFSGARLGSARHGSGALPALFFSSSQLTGQICKTKRAKRPGRRKSSILRLFLPNHPISNPHLGNGSDLLELPKREREKKNSGKTSQPLGKGSDQLNQAQNASGRIGWTPRQGVRPVKLRHILPLEKQVGPLGKGVQLVVPK